MKIKKTVRMFYIALLWVFCVGTVVACGSETPLQGRYYYPDTAGETDAGGKDESEDAASERTETADTDVVIGSHLFMIVSNDMQGECLMLEQLASGKQYMYYYSLTTRFLDKYGNRAAVSCFEPGRVVTIGTKDTEGRLTEVRISDEVWEYDDIVRFSVDEERGIFEIADTRYSYDNDLYIHSDGQRLWMSELSTNDEIRVVGIGKKLLSVAVTTGHGELELQNTDIFEGSFIQIGTKIFAEITENMTMELPEGTYTVTVANNGYGGSKEINIVRGETLTLDLDELKGEGPKYGNILFAIDVTGATLTIDGKQMDYSQAIPLKYGMHSISVNADSYDTYSKKLFVNSEEATIVVQLVGDSDVIETAGSDTSEDSASGDASDSSAGNSSTTGGTAGSMAGSMAGSTHTGTNSDTTSSLDSAEIDALVDEKLDSDGNDSSTDYLSTLSELLSTLTGSD